MMRFVWWTLLAVVERSISANIIVCLKRHRTCVWPAYNRHTEGNVAPDERRGERTNEEVCKKNGSFTLPTEGPGALIRKLPEAEARLFRTATTAVGAAPLTLYYVL